MDHPRGVRPALQPQAKSAGARSILKSKKSKWQVGRDYERRRLPVRAGRLRGHLLRDQKGLEDLGRDVLAEQDGRRSRSSSASAGPSSRRSTRSTSSALRHRRLCRIDSPIRGHRHLHHDHVAVSDRPGGCRPPRHPSQGRGAARLTTRGSSATSARRRRADLPPALRPAVRHHRRHAEPPASCGHGPSPRRGSRLQPRLALARTPRGVAALLRFGHLRGDGRATLCRLGRHVAGERRRPS